MTDVLIRDVPADDLEALRAAAVAEGSSLQAYLRAALRAHAAVIERRAVLAEIGARLADAPAVSDPVREEVFAAMRVTPGRERP